MNITPELSLEQRFNLKVYEAQLKQMDHNETQACLLEVLRQLMIKENVIKQLLKEVGQG
ncbi:MAG: NblA/ycf18 family protein [Cyanobacteria bacterium J06626_14]